MKAAMAAAAIPASTVLLLRDGAQGLEVLLITRHSASGFAAGALAFPGGKVDPADETLAPAALAPPGGAFRVAAIRETYEEAGLLLARRTGAEALLGHDEVMALPKISFAALMAEAGLELAADLLVPYAHWITPADSPKRFDTHFFLARAPEGQRPSADERETHGLSWMRPEAALAEADAGRASLVFATRMNLVRLAASTSVTAALDAARAAPVVTVCPEIVKRPEGTFFRIPEEAGYGGGEIPAAGIARAWAGGS
jgi:8-oxo-dGTP pyrophosphatase MutT (NUDIX family)